MGTYEEIYNKLARPDIAVREQNELLNAARVSFESARPGPLIAMLSSDDRSVRALGLQVYGWLGENSFPVLNAALALTTELSEWSRGHVLDGVLCYPSRLSSSQASTIVTMADDQSVVVRCKVANFIGCIELELLKLAISQIPEHSRKSEYEEGLAFHLLSANSLSFLLETAFAGNNVQSTFSFGAIDRLARSGAIYELPTYEDKSLNADLFLGNAYRLIKRQKGNKNMNGKP
jgi:hypothetical protein